MLLGTTLSALGLMLQKYAHNQQAQRDSREGHKTPDLRCGCVPSYVMNKVWLAGFAVFLMGHLIGWFALGLGPQTVLSCLNCWSMVMTFCVAPCILGEEVTVFRSLCVVILLIGCILVLVHGPRATVDYEVKDFVNMFDRTVVVVIVVMSVLLAAGVATFTFCSKKGPMAWHFVVLAAMTSWYSVLTAKCSSGLVFTSLYHQENQFGSWITYMLLFLMIVLASINLHFINMALKHGQAVFVVPAYEAVALVGQIGLGGIFFDEFANLTFDNIFGFIAGVIFVVLGVLFVSCHGPSIAWLQRPVLTPDNSLFGSLYPSLLPTPRGSFNINDRTEAEDIEQSEAEPSSYGSYDDAVLGSYATGDSFKGQRARMYT